jgi:hypothetical protein
MSIRWFGSDDDRVDPDGAYLVEFYARSRAAVQTSLAEAGHHLRVVQRSGPMASGAIGRRLGCPYLGRVTGMPFRDWQARELEGTMQVKTHDPRLQVRVGEYGGLEALEIKARPILDQIEDVASSTAEQLGRGIQGGAAAIGNLGEAAGNVASTGTSTFALVAPLVGPLLVLGGLAAVGAVAWWLISNPGLLAKKVLG